MDRRRAVCDSAARRAAGASAEEAAGPAEDGKAGGYAAALARLAAEIARLRADLDRVEHAMIALAGPGISASQMRELQTLDRLVQTVGDLAAFADALAEAAPHAHPSPPRDSLAARLKLEATRARLLGHDRAGEGDADEVDWL